MHSDDRTRTLGAQQLQGAERRAGEGFEVLLADQVKANAVQAFDVLEGGLRVAQSLFFKIGDTLMTGTTSPYL